MIQKTKKLNVTAQKELKQIKIGVVGDSGSGKTAFVQKFVHNDYNQSFNSTLGVETETKTIENSNGTITNITIWDFSGKLDFVEIRNQFYKEIDYLLVFCDLNSKATIDSVEYWLREAKDNGANNVGVVGNKTDLKKGAELQKICKDKGLPYFQISAKTGQGVNEMMKKVIGQFK